MSTIDENFQRQRSDTELVLAAKSGQLQAFGELVERSQGLARAVAYSASGDMASVEDLVQEALVTAWTRLHDLADPAAFRPWLAGIVRNTVRYWRRHQRRHAPRAQAGMETLSQLASGAPSPLDEAQWQQDWQHTSDALQSLPAKYREPLVLYYSMGESHAQVAQALGLSEASARQRVHRARKKLASEVSNVAAGGHRLAARTSAAAGVMLVIQRREAWAAPISNGAVTSVNPSLFVGLGALGGTAIVAAIVALVMLVGGEGESIGSPNATASAPGVKVSNAVTPDFASSATVPGGSSDVAHQGEVTGEATGDALGGVVSIGRGNVGDTPEPVAVRKLRAARAGNLDVKNYSSAADSTGHIKKHGPAVLHVEEAKPLMVPDIDMRAVEREMWQ